MPCKRRWVHLLNFVRVRLGQACIGGKGPRGRGEQMVPGTLLPAVLESSSPSSGQQRLRHCPCPGRPLRHAGLCWMGLRCSGSGWWQLRLHRAWGLPCSPAASPSLQMPLRSRSLSASALASLQPALHRVREATGRRELNKRIDRQGRSCAWKEPRVLRHPCSVDKILAIGVCFAAHICSL